MALNKRKKEVRILVDELKKISNEVLGILVYGSYAEKGETSRSDIDICIVAGHNDKIKLMKLFKKILLIMARDIKYDLKIFEHMPLYMKINVIEKGKPILTMDIPGLYEYFYFYRKLWNDQAIARMENVAGGEAVA